LSSGLANPYRGPQSFLGQHASLFHGREREARLLADLILREAVAILSAGSGAGKTSLLHARVIPMLEQAGAAVVYTHPEADTATTLVRRTIRQLFPPIEHELKAIQRVEQRASWISGLPLDDIPHAIASLREKSLQISLIEPIDPHAREAKIPNLPMVCRWLRGSISLERLVAHFDLMANRADTGDASEALPDSFVALQCRIRAATGRDVLIRGLLAAPKVDPARPIGQPEKIVADFAQPATSIIRAGLLLRKIAPTALVIILDQFEEFYNRYLVSPGDGRSDAADVNWVAREALFQQLGIILREGGVVPLRLLFSLRHEKLADLASELSSTGLIDRRTYILGALSLDMAREAIAMPAETAGRLVEQPALDRLVFGLRDVKPEVDAFILQLACWRLWDKSGGTPTITLEHVLQSFEVDAIGRAGDIAERTARLHLEDALTRDPNGSLEMLELLNALVTEKGTRDIVPRERLLDKWRLRDIAALRRSLATLLKMRVVRQTGLDRSVTYEITHERLIRPALELLKEGRERAGARGRLTAALQELYDQPAWSLRGEPEGKLTPQDRDALRASLSQTRLDPPAAAILLDSLLRGRTRRAEDRRTLQKDAARVALSLLLGRDPSERDEDEKWLEEGGDAWVEHLARLKEGSDAWVEHLARRHALLPPARVDEIVRRYQCRSVVSGEIQEMLLRSALNGDRAAIKPTVAAFFVTGADG
jgi:hypothetical protein